MTITREEFVESYGAKCPNCGSGYDEVPHYLIYRNAGIATKEAHCKKCGAKWYEEYKIHGFSKLETIRQKMFLICPVRNIEESLKQRLEQLVVDLEKTYDVYYPARDTDQNDDTGYRICTDNKDAIINADIIGVFWDGKSQGGLFDMGMAFALGKPIRIFSVPQKTEGKSFQNMMYEWESK